MRDIALVIVFIVLISLSFRRPWLGLLVWSWLSYMNPHRLTFGFAYLLPFVAITAGVTVFSWYISSESKQFPWTRETILELLLCIWITVTTLFALNQGDSLNPFSISAWDQLSRALKIQAMIFMTYFVIKDRFRLNALVWTIVLSIGFYGVKGGIWAFLTGGSSMVRGPEKTMIEGNNEIALALVMVLPLMRYLELHTGKKWVRWGLLAAQVLTTLAILSTYSRGGFLALCAVGFLLWLKSRKKVVLALVMLLVIPPLIHFMPQTWGERMQTISADQDSLDSSALGRLNAWGFAWNLAKDRPIIGGGFRVFFLRTVFQQYAPDPTDFHDSHSIYFEVLAEHGFVGLTLFLGLGLSTLLTGRWTIRKARKTRELLWIRDLVAMTQVGLVGYAVGGAFAGLAFFDLPYHMMSIIVLCSVLVKRHTRATASGEDEAEIRSAPETVAGDMVYAVE